MLTRHQGAVLVVEDGDEDYEVLRLTMERMGVNNPLHRCTDAEAALTYLGKDDSADLMAYPQLIFLDLNLPDTDGRELLQVLKQDEALRHIPVVVLTTSNNPKDIALCYSRGANCYAIKPVGLDKFEHLVQLLCEFWLSAVELPH